MPEWRDLVAAPDAAGAAEGELRRFVLEQHPVRAFWTRLDSPWQELSRLQQYAAPVERLLGEAVTASVLLAATLKFHGTLTLQLQGNACVRLLVAQCTHDLRIRALARVETAVTPAAQFRELVGESRLAVTVESDERGSRYQGIVALEGATLSACLENYFAASEQLPTRIRLEAGAGHASGLLLQKMPSGRVEADTELAWEDVQRSLSALPAQLLRQGSPEEVLRRVGGEHDGRVFAGSAVRFACRCSTQRVAGLLRSLGAQEIQALLSEQGAVTVTCEFCGRPYRFDTLDVERLFAGDAGLEAPRSIN
jgi:molecular chaperone Hsp33